MKKLISYFGRGMIAIVPLAITLYTFYFIFVKIDGLINFPVPGVGFLLAIFLVIFVGFLASNIFTTRLLSFVERMFEKIPLAKMLYNSTKDLLSAFLGDKKSFEKPVLVTIIPGSNVKVLGFITKESLISWGVADEVAVYLPQSYNFAGNLIVVPRQQIALLNVSSSEVMAFIVSGGITETK